MKKFQFLIVDPNGFGCSGVVGDKNSGCTALNVSMDALALEAEGLNVSLAELLSQPKEKSSVLSVAEWRRCDQMEGYEWMPTEVMDSVVSEVRIFRYSKSNEPGPRMFTKIYVPGFTKINVYKNIYTQKYMYPRMFTKIYVPKIYVQNYVR